MAMVPVVSGDISSVAQMFAPNLIRMRHVLVQIEKEHPEATEEMERQIRLTLECEAVLVVFAHRLAGFRE